MKTLRDIIIERLVQNKKLQKLPTEEMNDYVTELNRLHDYDLLDEFEIMLTEAEV